MKESQVYMILMGMFFIGAILSNNFLASFILLIVMMMYGGFSMLSGHLEYKSELRKFNYDFEAKKLQREVEHEKFKTIVRYLDEITQQLDNQSKPKKKSRK